MRSLPIYEAWDEMPNREKLFDKHGGGDVFGTSSRLRASLGDRDNGHVRDGTIVIDLYSRGACGCQSGNRTRIAAAVSKDFSRGIEQKSTRLRAAKLIAWSGPCKNSGLVELGTVPSR